jgi:class 3 adenylate cyclase
MTQNNRELKKEILTMVVGDIVSSSSLTVKFGAFDAGKTLEWFVHRVDQQAKTHQARFLKFWGDGFIAAFSSPKEAVIFAIEIKNQLAHPDFEGRPLQIIIAIHTSDVAIASTSYGKEIFGSGVAYAARLESVGKPGEIIISETARNFIDEIAGTQVIAGGKTTVKQLGSVQIFKLVASGEVTK